MAAPPRRVILEADGGSRGNPGPAAYGAVLKDADTGEVLAEAAETIGRATNNVAEYRGLLAGLEMLRTIAPDAELEARMDSKLVVEQMAGRWKVKNDGLRPLAVQAQRLAPRRVRWKWIPRERNSHADRLLNEALDGAPTRREGPTADQPQFLDPTVQPTTLLLVRHGETAATLARRFSGRNGDDPEMTDHGRAQAAAIGEWLAARGDVRAVVASPLRRARDTGQVVADLLGLPLAVDDDLAEADFGQWEGLTYDDVRARWPAELKAWLGDVDAVPPGGESFAAAQQRVLRALDRLLQGHPRQIVVVVTHMTPIATLVLAALEAPLHSLLRVRAPLGSCSIVAWYPDGQPVLHSFAVSP